MLYAAYEAFVADISRTIPVIQVDWESFGDVEALANAISREVTRTSWLRRVTL